MSDPVSTPTSDVEGAATVSPWNRLSVAIPIFATLFTLALGCTSPPVTTDCTVATKPTVAANPLVATSGRPGAIQGAGPSVTVRLTRQLIWVDRAGQVEPVDSDWWFYRGIPSGTGHSISPDGTRIALKIFTEESGEEIWVRDLDSGQLSRITFSAGENRRPLWVDNETVIFLSTREGADRHRQVWSTRTDGAGSAQLVFDPGTLIAGAMWSPDQEWLLLRTAGFVNDRGMAIEGSRDIFYVRPGLDSLEQPLLADPAYDETQPVISWDGCWIAYTSTETGIPEVYVRPFPDVDADKVRVSNDGGIMPYWAHNGRELFFMELGAGPVAMMAADFETAPGFRVVERKRLFTVPADVPTNPVLLTYDVTPDDRRFLMARNYTEN